MLPQIRLLNAQPTPQPIPQSQQEHAYSRSPEPLVRSPTMDQQEAEILSQNTAMYNQLVEFLQTHMRAHDVERALNNQRGRSTSYVQYNQRIMSLIDIYV